MKDLTSKIATIVVLAPIILQNISLLRVMDFDPSSSFFVISMLNIVYAVIPIIVAVVRLLVSVNTPKKKKLIILNSLLMLIPIVCTILQFIYVIMQDNLSYSIGIYAKIYYTIYIMCTVVVIVYAYSIKLPQKDTCPSDE
ncbi:MAG: hypothetical protein IJ219_09150 [Bacteroidaceae bacterium]|nr:hypothetical protein [Bacteroidaceae bacterium]